MKPTARIKKHMEESGISAAQLARMMDMPERTMQHRFVKDNWTVEELERIEAVLGITIFNNEAPKNVGHLEEPSENGKYGQPRTINIVIQLGQSTDNPLAQKLEEGLLEWLASQGKKP